jgi:hypothetical protein
MRIVFARAAAARTLLLAATLVALVTTVLLSAFALYAQYLPVAGARAAIREAPPHERTLLVSTDAGDTAEALAARDAAVRDVFAGGLASVALPTYGAARAGGQELALDSVADETFAVVGVLTDLPEHAELVAGAWAEPVPPGEPAQATLPAAVASELGLGIGDEVPIADRRSDGEPAPLLVVGVWEPIDAGDPYWRLFSEPFALGWQGPFVVHPDEFTARYLRLARLEWLAAPDPAALVDAPLSAAAAGLDGISRRLTDPEARDPALSGTVQFRTGLRGLAEQLETATVVNRSGIVLPAALLAVVAGYGLVLLARLLTEHRRGETALLRARGASPRQLTRLASVEAAMVVTPAALLGAPLGTQLVIAADERAGGRSLGVAADLAEHGLFGPPLAVVVAIGAALGCALALVLPSIGRQRTWVAEQQQRSRPRKAALVGRAGVDLGLVALALLSWTQLRQYETAVANTDAGLGVDPLLVAAPVVGTLAAAVLALRLLPLATRLGVRLVARRGSFPSLLGMWQADRRPHAGPVFLLVLAVATAVLAPTVATTWQRSQRDQAAQQVGADLRVDTVFATASAGDDVRAALPDTATMMPVLRSTVGMPEFGWTALLGFDTEPAASVALLRPDLAPGGVDDVFATLREGRPEPAGVPLPEGAARLVTQFRFVASHPVVRVEPPTAYVADARGAVTAVRLLPPDGAEIPDQLAEGTELAAELPPGTTRLVGLGAGALNPRWMAGQVAEPRPVTWHWDELRVEASGGETPLEIPGSWRAEHRGGAPEPERIADEPAAVAGWLVLQFPSRTRFVLREPAPMSADSIPVVVTPDVLAASGREIGQELAVSGAVIDGARLAGVVDAVPGTETGSGVMVDLAWLSQQQFNDLRSLPTPTEWWVATSDPSAAAAVGELEQVRAVYDRQAESHRLLEDPLGAGVLVALWAAAAAAAVLAAFGLVVDSRATAVRRRRELAVLHTLGTPPPALARALVVEQAVLAGLGVAAGVLVGIGVAAAMGTSLILTPTGAEPVPEPLLTLAPAQFAAPTLGLFAVAIGLGAVVAWRARREVVARALRIGEE